MKKVLFILQEYTQGGITKCLENMLGFIKQTDLDIYVYSLYEDGGDYYKRVFSDRIVAKSKLYYYLHDNKYTRKLMGAYNKMTHRFNFGFLYRHEATYLQNKYHFDVVVAYHEGMTVEFASYFSDAKKVTWFHCDPKILGRSMLEDYSQYYNQMNIVVGVSNVVKTSFLELMPHFKGEVQVIHNLLDTDMIKDKSKEHISDFPKHKGVAFNIISIGRSTKVKQFEKIPEIMHRIIEQGTHHVYWYIIASGNECNQEIVQAIEDNGMKNHVILLGEKDNPYPYIKHSDLLVSTSYSEAYPTVINEAQVLGVPVMANNYPSAEEIIFQGCGIVCPLDDMAISIIKMAKDSDEYYSKMKKQVSEFHYENDEILQKINQLFV